MILRSSLVIALLFAQLMFVTAHGRAVYTIPRVNQSPDINGTLGEGEWTKASMVELKYDVNPGDSTPAPVKTIAYMMEDGETLYISFKAYDPEPEKIRAFLRDRDGIFQDDFVGVVLDTFNDERRGFEFFVNPLGSQGDLTLDDNLGNEDSSWDTVWESSGSLTDDGFVVEMAIPFRSLRFTADLPEQIWGIRFLRIYPRDARTVIADSPGQRELDCSLCIANKVRGMPALKSVSANLDVTPTLTYLTSEERDVNPVSDWEQVADETEVGIDLRWAMSEDWILNATINPDFSQVEADAGQLDVNTTFSLFFPEARPFFLDGADYFSSMNRLVHTRNIADPKFGAKVTGKTNGYTVGAITAKDEVTSFLLPGSLGSSIAELDTSSNVLIARGQADTGKKGNIGALVTHRSATGYKNQVVAIDGKHYFTDKDILSYQWMYSDSENPESIQFDSDCVEELAPNQSRESCRDLNAEQSDRSLTMNYRHNEENYSVRASYNDFGKDFRADTGFISRVDYRKLIIGGDYTWFGKEGSKWTRWGFFGDWDRTEDQSGRKLEEEFEIHMNIRGPMQFNTNFGVVSRERFFDDEYFDEKSFMMWFEIKPWSNVTFGNFMQFGDQIDFTNTQLGELTLFEPYVEWQIGRHLNLELNYTQQELDVTGGNLFKAQLLDLRASYQFSIRSRLSLTIQGTEISRNLALYDANQDTDPDNDFLAQSKRAGTQLIYSYKINPQSLFYLGYSDNYLENDEVQNLERTDRTFFAKFSYLWQH